MLGEEAALFPSRDLYLGGEGSLSGLGSRARSARRAEPPPATILFISPSPAQDNLQTDWAEASGGAILRQCPLCRRDSIVGHGRRRKQAHYAYHDWIQIRRGLCNLFGKTFAFLPLFSPPCGHYSLITRSQALRRYFVVSFSAMMREDA
jgi:hypothetical protein